MGEAVLRQVAKERGLDLEVDSAGTAAYHVSEPPDERTVEICEKHDVPIDHQARKVKAKDFHEFTYILAADKSNLANLQSMAPEHHAAVVRLWGSYLDGKPMADPYYGGMDGFEQVYQQCVAYSNAFLDEVFGKTPAESS